MTWITENWVGILIAVAFVGMHLFGHRGHGGHGGQSGTGHSGHGGAPQPAPEPGDAASADPSAAKPKPPVSGGHNH